MHSQLNTNLTPTPVFWERCLFESCIKLLGALGFTKKKKGAHTEKHIERETRARIVRTKNRHDGGGDNVVAPLLPLLEVWFVCLRAHDFLPRQVYARMCTNAYIGVCRHGVLECAWARVVVIPDQPQLPSGISG